MVRIWKRYPWMRWVVITLHIYFYISFIYEIIYILYCTKSFYIWYIHVSAGIHTVHICIHNRISHPPAFIVLLFMSSFLLSVAHQTERLRSVDKALGRHFSFYFCCGAVSPSAEVSHSECSNGWWRLASSTARVALHSRRQLFMSSCFFHFIFYNLSLCFSLSFSSAPCRYSPVIHPLTKQRREGMKGRDWVSGSQWYVCHFQGRRTFQVVSTSAHRYDTIWVGFF